MTTQPQSPFATIRAAQKVRDEAVAEAAQQKEEKRLAELQQKLDLLEPGLRQILDWLGIPSIDWPPHQDGDNWSLRAEATENGHTYQFILNEWDAKPFQPTKRVAKPVEEQDPKHSTANRANQMQVDDGPIVTEYHFDFYIRVVEPDEWHTDEEPIVDGQDSCRHSTHKDCSVNGYVFMDDIGIGKFLASTGDALNTVTKNYGTRKTLFAGWQTAQAVKLMQRAPADDVTSEQHELSPEGTLIEALREFIRSEQAEHYEF